MEASFAEVLTSTVEWKVLKLLICATPTAGSPANLVSVIWFANIAAGAAIRACEESGLLGVSTGGLFPSVDR